MYRVGITLKDGNLIAKNFETKAQCEEWILKQSNIKKAIIINKENIKEREIINF